MAELSATYLEMNQFEIGSTYLDKVLSLTEQYSQAEKQFIAALCYFYGKNISDPEKAKLYHLKMADIGYSVKDFE